MQHHQKFQIKTYWFLAFKQTYQQQINGVALYQAVKLNQQQAILSLVITNVVVALRMVTHLDLTSFLHL